ncbi:MAG TPA: PEP/pyruvate-binding domain-containing protein [Chitinispirillaceae bacterium]|nr:PEP/pyruvate-binding domain-containing protein [Chitinispirillaceae bacterium]
MILFVFCSDDPVEKPPVTHTWACVIPGGAAPDSARSLGCEDDFKTLSSQPLNANIPGATSVKTVIDNWNSNNSQLYFQNCKKYKIHHEFAFANLSGRGKQLVDDLAKFNIVEYTSEERRFLLGAITYYEGPKKWTYEIASIDNANAEMISLAYQKIASNCFFGDSLYFHPINQFSESAVKSLPASVKVITTNQLYEGITYQPLNYGTSIGKLVFMTAKQLEDGQYVSFRDIVVLDAVPNDISVTSGIITQAFQTPLSHINVLSQNRGTPNMGLKNATIDSTLLALKGKWVKLEVGSYEYKVTEATQQEADEWWEAHRPAQVSVAKMNLEVKDLRDINKILDYPKLKMADAIDSAIPAFGGKASHFGCFPYMDSTKVPYPKGFAIPVYFYHQFMEQNGFLERVTFLLSDSMFNNDFQTRDKRLKKLRKDMEDAPVDTAFTKMLMAKLNSEYPGIKMRFRSSTNAEDLDGFTGAGLYTSKSGEPGDTVSVLDAIREVWSSVWYFRAFEERTYRKISHENVGMALLVHQSFPDEEATGVAITANPYDVAQSEPAFYINVQYGDGSVVLPDANVTSDEFIYYFYAADKPIIYKGHSNVLPAGKETVLTPKQCFQLGEALKVIHEFYYPIYGKPGQWFAMDTEFKFDQPLNNPDAEPVLSMKQARPYPGMGQK